MARITSQKAAEAIGGQFRLVLAAAQRARSLDKKQFIGDRKKDGIIIQSLKDIEEGRYSWDDYLKDRK